MKSLNLKDNIEDILITSTSSTHLIRLLAQNDALFIYLVLDKQKANLALSRHQLAGVRRIWWSEQALIRARWWAYPHSSTARGVDRAHHLAETSRPGACSNRPFWHRFDAMSRRARPVNVVLEPILISSAMKRLDRVLRSVADKDVVVCLVGESGSGKDVIARRIHELSPRRAHPFAPINCAAIPDALFESELFGHERGAFTGANQLARGKIEAASGGSLFLDEIGELPLPASQAAAVPRESALHSRRWHDQDRGRRAPDLRHAPSARRRSPPRHVPRRSVLPHSGDHAPHPAAPRAQGRPRSPDRRADGGNVEQALSRGAAARASSDRRAPETTRGPATFAELRNVVEQLCLLRSGKNIRATDLPPMIQALPPITRPLTTRPRAPSWSSSTDRSRRPSTTSSRPRSPSTAATAPRGRAPSRHRAQDHSATPERSQRLELCVIPLRVGNLVRW